MNKRIKSLEELRGLASQNDGVECFIALNYGLISRKMIAFRNGKWWIMNFIDNTDQKLTDKNLMNKTNIYRAIQKGALYLEN